jgi:abhydrolase domain-containing protein 6
MKFSEKQFKNHQGLKTIYYDSESAKPTFVFIHGGIAHPLKSYGKILTNLSENYRVIAPEVPGFTNDYYPERPLGLDELAYFFNELLEKAGVSEYYVSGHSMGGGIAILMAAENNQALKVIASNSAGHPLKLSEKGLAFSMAMKVIRQSYSKQGIKVLKKLYHNIKEVAENNGESKSAFALKSAHYAMKQDYSNLISKVASPTLLIHAKKDNLFRKNDAQYLAQLIPQAKLIDVRGFHDWAMHEQEKFAKLTRNFLENNKIIF